jgi:hypothetical protein
MTTKPPQRRLSDLDVIRRAAVILTGDPDPVRAAVSEWLRDVAAHYDELSLAEIRYAADVARAALIELVTSRIDPPCQPDCPTCHPVPAAQEAAP